MNLLEEQTAYLLGDDEPRVIQEEHDNDVVVDGVSPVSDKEYDIVSDEPDDFLKIDDRYIELYLRWLVTNYEVKTIKSRMAIHDKQSEILRNRNGSDQAIDKQDVLSALCEFGLMLAKGKKLPAMVKKVRSFIDERKSFKD